MTSPGVQAVDLPLSPSALDDHPLTSVHKRVVLFCCLVLVLDGFDSQSIGFVAPSMAQALHVPVHAFGPVFSAALFGLMISAIVAGPVADRIGRKWPIIVSTFTFALFTIATGRASSLHSLILFRFLTGLGLGGAMPNVVALATEYAPRRLQQVLVTAIFCGMPLGALIGGLVSSVMLTRWGWQSVFYAGGFLPLALAFLLVFLLPESALFLRQSLAEGVSNGPQTGGNAHPAAEAPHQRALILQLFTEGRAVGTLLLWSGFFMNLLILYFILSWLPALLHQKDMSVSVGIAALSIFSVGGILGCLTEGAIMKKWGAFRVLLLEFLTIALLVVILANLRSVPLLLTVTFLLGLFVQGCQAGLNAIAATSYPTSIRATGVGSALGMGRLGSIVGPFLGGIMLGAGWSPSQVILMGAAPASLGALSILASRLTHRSMFRSRP